MGKYYFMSGPKSTSFSDKSDKEKAAYEKKVEAHAKAKAEAYERAERKPLLESYVPTIETKTGKQRYVPVRDMAKRASEGTHKQIGEVKSGTNY